MTKNSLWLTVCLSLSLGACASIHRAQYEHQKATAYVYQAPIETVWPEVRGYIFEKGWKISDKSSSAADKTYYFETTWAPTYNGSSEWKSYLIQGTPEGDKACRINVKSISRYNGQPSGGATREGGIEWDLLKRIDPGAADQIEGEAQTVQ